MGQQQRKFPKPCPAPEDGPFALILWRLDQLEEKMDMILPKIYQSNGIVSFLKILGSFLVGAAIVAAFFISHISFH